jgi:glycosyltransferase involved in cell wall biosynthesis
MTLCLNMIVKDESHIIEQTLENICQHFKLDYWVISDTGSSDRTPEIIENFFKAKNIQGEIIYEAWQNFSYNRNIALKACLGKSDYILIFNNEFS